MANYMIFVVVLTIAYIIYYGYNISKDLYGKKTDKEPEVETFDIADMEEPSATPVRESDSGFSVGGNVAEPISEDGEEETTSDGSKWNVKMFEGKLEEADVQSEGGITNEELEVMLITRNSNIRFQPNIKINRDNY